MKNNQISLKQISLCNDWLFGRVMSDSELCQPLLEKILNLKIRKVKLIHNQKTIDYWQSSKGIRLDIFIADEEDTIFNVEMQLENRDIRKRSRYYQSSIDLGLMPKGGSYRNLNTSYIIFICVFDMFGQGRHIYSFQNRYDQDGNLRLGDGSYKFFLNTRGKLDDVDQELKDILTYIEDSTEQTAKNSKSELVKKIHKKVEDVRNCKESEVDWMTYMEKLWEEREDGKIEGIKEGKIAITRKLVREGISIDIIKRATGFSDEEIEGIRDNNLSMNN